MNTYTNAMHPEKKVHRPARNNLFPTIAIITVILTLVTGAAIAIYGPNRPIAAENNPAVPYSNVLELQYARPWLEAQNNSVVEYGNALEMQYAQPWLDKDKLTIVVTGNTQGQIPLNCHSNMEMLYACKYGYGRP